VAGFWRAPRALARMRAERELSLSAYALVHFLGESGADRPAGLVTTNAFLASALELSERTIRRALRRLREQGLVGFEDHAGVAPFRVRTSDMTRLLMSDPVSGPVSEVASDTTSDTPAPSRGREPASPDGKPALAASDASRAHTRARGDRDREKLLLEASLGSKGPAETGPPPPQEAASAAQVGKPADPEPEVPVPGRPRSRGCPFQYETGPCGVRCADEAALAAHLANVHGVEPEHGHYEPAPPPVWERPLEGE
jgi:hypothetical protein